MANEQPKKKPKQNRPLRTINSTTINKKMTKRKALTGKKKKMYEALRSQLGVISAAARIAKIDRTTHYLWLNNDENYKEWVADIPEETHDFAENALLKQIKNGNVTSIIFYLKTKAKHRGWVENVNINANVNNMLTVDSFADAWERIREGTDSEETGEE